ncbi:hypothetical protein [Aurantiacibacter flavus]|uniref:Uncharacterized protein n=1 Tax=Aurantiacibacter flavus TaxID=3145232 RepID=A0ABV0CXQ6_9SPHN
MGQFLLPLIAGVVSAISTQGLIYFFDLRKAWRQSNHLALRLSNEFERFAEVCMSSICRNRDSWQESNNPDRQITSLPDSPQLFDDDPGWETLNRPLAAEILGFRQAIEHASGYVSNEFYFGSPATAWVIRDDQAVGLGVGAASIAERLRDVHGQHKPQFEWDYHDRLDQ